MSSSSNETTSGNQTPVEVRPKKRTRNQCPDKVLLEPENLARINAWRDQVIAHHQGAIKPTRNDIANVVLSLHAELLSEEELTRLWDRSFDPVRFLKGATAQVEAAQARGEKWTITDLLKQLREKAVSGSGTNDTITVRKRGRKPKVQGESVAQPDLGALDNPDGVDE